MKNKVDKLDVDKLVPFPVDLSNLGDVVKDDVVQKGVYNAKIKNIEDKIPDITKLATNTNLNAKKKWSLATTTALTAIQNKILNVSKLVKKNWP